MIYTALASMIAIPIRPLVVSLVNVEVKVGLSTEGVPRPRADLNVTSMAKAFPNPALHNHPNSKLPGEKKVAPHRAQSRFPATAQWPSW
jgi:hypothetical protein